MFKFDVRRHDASELHDTTFGPPLFSDKRNFRAAKITVQVYAFGNLDIASR